MEKSNSIINLKKALKSVGLNYNLQFLILNQVKKYLDRE